MLAIWKINSFSKLNTIAQDSSIILVLFKKHDELNLVNFTKKLSTAKFNSMLNFLLIQYVQVVVHYTTPLLA